jgi:hypothetical protein
MHAAREFASRAGYCGIAPPPAPRVPRQPEFVIRELRAAAEALGELADTALAVGVNPILIASADTLSAGINRLIVELRQGSRA